MPMWHSFWELLGLIHILGPVCELVHIRRAPQERPSL